MSIATISYSSLGNASNEAKGVARKLISYANSLNNNVYRKLNNYNGNHTQNIQEAKSYVNNKINDLRTQASKYETYASDLETLKTTCSNVDTTVKNMISQLTGTFKNNHGITNSKVLNGINYFLTSIENATNLGRWLGDGKDKKDAMVEHIKESIKDWWDYNGGKELVTGMAVAVLEVVAGICTIVATVATIASGGWTIGLVAGLIGGVITTINGVTNGINESRAYEKIQAGDPATGRRLSSQDTVQDTIRAEVVDNASFWYKVANGIDIVNFGCFIVNIFSCGKTLIKNAYKWTTGSMANIKNLRVRDILTKTNLKAFGSKVCSTFSDGWDEIKSAFRMKDFTTIKKFFFDFGDDFVNNLKDTYLNFDSIKDGAGSIKEIASVAGDIIDGGFNLKNILWDVGIHSMLLPNLNMGELVTYKADNPRIAGSILSYDIDAIHIDDVTGLIGKVISKFTGDNIFSDNSTISKDLIKKLSKNCDIDISIPDVKIPKIDGGIVNRKIFIKMGPNGRYFDIPTINKKNIALNLRRIDIKIPPIVGPNGKLNIYYNWKFS